MPKNPRKKSYSSSQYQRPGQDVKVARQQAGQFPGIGTTLSSYHQPADQRRSRGASRPGQIKKPIRKKLFKRISLKRTFITLLIIALLIGGFLGVKFAYELQKAFGGNIFGLFFPTKLKGEDTGHVNILLAGDSSDDPGHQGADLTDSIMIISLNTKNNTGWVLSIPRDMLTHIPNHGYQKINAVYEFGNADNFSSPGFPNGGMGELEQIVDQKFGLNIDYYALIDYGAFKQAVNAVGGITVDIQSSDPRGIYDAYTHLRLPNGMDNLNGQQALNLARARGDYSAGDVGYGLANGDFTRTKHQREMLVALKAKAESTGVLANPIALSNLFSALGNNVKSDLTISDVRRLYDLSNKIPNSKLSSLSLDNVNGQSLLQSYYYDGQDGLIPAAGFDNYSAIQNFIQSQLK